MVKKINTPQVIEEVAKRMGCFKKDAREMLEHFSAVIVEHASRGEKVSFKPLGIFYIHESKKVNGHKLRLKYRATKDVLRKINKSFEESDLIEEN